MKNTVEKSRNTRFTQKVLLKNALTDCPQCGSPIHLIRIDYHATKTFIHYFACADNENCRSFGKATRIGDHYELLEELADKELRALRKEIKSIINAVTINTPDPYRMARAKLYDKEILYKHLAYSFPHWPDVKQLNQLSKSEAKELYSRLKDYYGPYLLYSERNFYYKDKFFSDNNLLA